MYLFCDQRGAKDVESTANQSMEAIKRNEGTVGRIDAVHGSELPNGNSPTNVSISFHCIILSDISLTYLKNCKMHCQVYIL